MVRARLGDDRSVARDDEGATGRHPAAGQEEREGSALTLAWTDVGALRGSVGAGWGQNRAWPRTALRHRPCGQQDKLVSPQVPETRVGPRIPSSRAPQGKHGITLIREPDPKELEQIERADRLILSASNASAYQRCRDVLEVIHARLAELQGTQTAAGSKIQSLRAAFSSLNQALDRLTGELPELVREHGTERAAEGTPMTGRPVHRGLCPASVESAKGRRVHGTLLTRRPRFDDT
jgi:hypothetical protein